MKQFFLIVIGWFMIASCHQSANHKSIDVDSTIVSNKFVIPQVPSIISDQKGQISYILSHYWENFDFTNNDLINNNEITEQAFVDYINLFNQVNQEEIKNSVEILLSKAEQNPQSITYFKNQFENYLYNPNSPMRNEEHYEPVLNYLISSKNINETEKSKYRILLDLVKKNRVGTKAASFNFRLPSGEESRLINVNTPYTMLFFYEPGCSSCETAIKEMKDNKFLNDLIQDNQLIILAIYTLGDEREWREYQNNIPSNWINGNSGNQIRDNQLYDLKASPTIYLLDSNKKVILKDCYLAQILEFLST